jgi:O-antigen ligase
MRRFSFYFLIVFIFSLPWQSFIVISGLGTISRLFGLLLVGVAIIYILNKKNVKEPSILLIVTLIFIVWGLLSYLWSIHQPTTISRFVTYIQLFAMLWLIWELCDSKKDYHILMRVFVLGLFISIYDMINLYFSYNPTDFRIAATGFNPNRIAVYLAVGIPVAWYLFLNHKKGLLYWVYLSYIPLAMFCIILTASRTGLVVGIVALLIVPFTILALNDKKIIGFLLFSIVLVATITVISSDIYSNIERNIERLATTTDGIESGEFGGRGIIWKEGVSIFKEYPLRGVGLGAGRIALGDRLGREERAPHSAYISLLTDVGLIGFILFYQILIIALLPIFYISLNYTHKIFYIFLIITLLVAMIPSSLENDKVMWFILSLFQCYGYLLFKYGKFKIIKR